MSVSETTPAIEINGLTYAYGRAEAVHDLNLTVRRGCCYGLFGRNGAGKTTTMKCLLNLLLAPNDTRTCRSQLEPGSSCAQWR